METVGGCKGGFCGSCCSSQATAVPSEDDFSAHAGVDSAACSSALSTSMRSQLTQGSQSTLQHEEQSQLAEIDRALQALSAVTSSSREKRDWQRVVQLESENTSLQAQLTELRALLAGCQQEVAHTKLELEQARRPQRHADNLMMALESSQRSFAAAEHEHIALQERVRELIAGLTTIQKERDDLVSKVETLQVAEAHLHACLEEAQHRATSRELSSSSEVAEAQRGEEAALNALDIERAHGRKLLEYNQTLQQQLHDSQARERSALADLAEAEAVKKQLALQLEAASIQSASPAMQWRLGEVTTKLVAAESQVARLEEDKRLLTQDLEEAHSASEVFRDRVVDVEKQLDELLTKRENTVLQNGRLQEHITLQDSALEKLTQQCSIARSEAALQRDRNMDLHRQLQECMSNMLDGDSK